MTSALRAVGWGAVALVPVAAMGLLLGGVVRDPTLAAPVFHFYVVSFTCLLAMGLALVMLAAGQQLKDVRVFFMALGFLGIAGIFLVHALTTPGVIAQASNPWVGFSARLSLLVGAIFLALGSQRWSPGTQARVIRHQSRIVATVVLALLLFGAFALQSSIAFGGESIAPAASDYAASGYGGRGDAATPPDDLSDDLVILAANSTVGDGVSTVTLGLLFLVCLRLTQLYRLSRSPTLAGFLVSAIFLFQAQLSMSITTVWHASWWEYHGLMLAGLGAALLGLVLEYNQGGSLAGVVEGLLVRDTIRQLERGYDGVIVALVEAVEAKDAYTRGHTQRVATLSARIGEEIGISPERLRVLHRSAMLHDIGKIAVPDSILNKPGRLTPEEFAIVQEHPVRGHLIVRNVRTLREEIGGIRWHHERLDGSGYPDRLAGEAIPLEARIIAVADVFDALTSRRAYRGAWNAEQALEVIDGEAGTKLDPTCVAALHRVLAKHAVQANPTEAATALAEAGSQLAGT